MIVAADARAMEFVLSPDAIVLAKDLSLVGTLAEVLRTPWLAWPTGYQNFQAAVVCQSLATGTVDVRVETTWDTDSTTVTLLAGVGGPGTQVNAFTAALGPLVRLNILITAASASLVLSVYLTPKSE